MLEMSFLSFRAAAAYNVCMYVWIRGGEGVGVGDDGGTMREVTPSFSCPFFFSVLCLHCPSNLLRALPYPIPFRRLIHSIDARRLEAPCSRFCLDGVPEGNVFPIGIVFFFFPSFFSAQSGRDGEKEWVRSRRKKPRRGKGQTAGKEEGGSSGQKGGPNGGRGIDYTPLWPPLPLRYLAGHNTSGAALPVRT